jgi:hypothetical protein
MGSRRAAYRILVALGRHGLKLEDNIRRDLQKVGSVAWTGLIWLMLGQMVVACECGNEPSVFIRCGGILGWLRNCLILKKSCAVWS